MPTQILSLESWVRSSDKQNFSSQPGMKTHDHESDGAGHDATSPINLERT
jgi:hypothetical protein